MAFSGGCPCEEKDAMVVQDKLDSIIAELKQIKIILSWHMAGLVSSKDTEVHLSTDATQVEAVQRCARLATSKMQGLSISVACSYRACSSAESCQHA